MAKLYPPVIEGTIPAFYGTTLVVPFSMNRSVAKSDIKGFSLKIKTVQTNTFVKNLTSTDYTTSEVKFDISEVDLVAGQYYKLQLAYIFNDTYATIGYYSTVGVVKYYGEEGPKIYVDGLSSKNSNIFAGSYVGVFEHEDDPMEKVAQYRFIIEQSNGDIVTDTGWLLHNTINDINSLSSNDNFKYDDDLDADKVYYLYYKVMTSNNMECSTPGYRILQKNSVGLGLNIGLAAENNFDNGYVSIRITDTDEETTLNGSFEISRQNIKTPKHWDPIFVFVLQAEEPGVSVWKDFTVEQGETYRYCIRQFNASNMYSDRVISNEVYVDFEDAFLFDGKRQLKIRYNPKVSSFKNDILESKTDTIGSKYPFIFRNGHVNYKEFPISGLISYWSDEEHLFMSNEDIDIVDGETLVRDEELPWNLKTTNLVNYNIAAERRFKLEALEWLTNGKPKLFRSPGEGNYIVRLLNTTLTPTDAVNRMLHTFNCTAYEVSEITYNTLAGYGFIKSVLDDDEIKREYYRSVPLGWQGKLGETYIKTDDKNPKAHKDYYYMDENDKYILLEEESEEIYALKFKEYKDAQNLFEIDYMPVITGRNRQYPVDDDGCVELLTNPYNKDEVIKATSIRFDDMDSTDIIYVNGEKRMIGSTGVYNLDNGDIINSVKVRSVADYYKDDYETDYEAYEINVENRKEKVQKIQDSLDKKSVELENKQAEIYKYINTATPETEEMLNSRLSLQNQITTASAESRTLRIAIYSLQNQIDDLSKDLDYIDLIDPQTKDLTAAKNNISLLEKKISGLEMDNQFWGIRGGSRPEIGENSIWADTDPVYGLRYNPDMIEDWEEAQWLAWESLGGWNTNLINGDPGENPNWAGLKFKGKIGTKEIGQESSNIIEALPVNPESGDAYRVITKGIYNGFSCDVDDIIAYLGSSIGWVSGKRLRILELKARIESINEEIAKIDNDDSAVGIPIRDIKQAYENYSNTSTGDLVGEEAIHAKELETKDRVHFLSKIKNFYNGVMTAREAQSQLGALDNTLKSIDLGDTLGTKSWTYTHAFNKDNGHYLVEGKVPASTDWTSTVIKNAKTKLNGYYKQKNKKDSGLAYVQAQIEIAQKPLVENKLPKTREECNKTIEDKEKELENVNKEYDDLWDKYDYFDPEFQSEQNRLIQKITDLTSEIKKYKNYLTDYKTNYDNIDGLLQKEKTIKDAITKLDEIQEKLKPYFSLPKEVKTDDLLLEWKFFYDSEKNANKTKIDQKPSDIKFDTTARAKADINADETTVNNLPFWLEVAEEDFYKDRTYYIKVLKTEAKITNPDGTPTGIKYINYPNDENYYITLYTGDIWVKDLVEENLYKKYYKYTDVNTLWKAINLQTGKLTTADYYNMLTIKKNYEKVLTLITKQKNLIANIEKWGGNEGEIAKIREDIKSICSDIKYIVSVMHGTIDSESQEAMDIDNEKQEIQQQIIALKTQLREKQTLKDTFDSILEQAQQELTVLLAQIEEELLRLRDEGLDALTAQKEVIETKLNELILSLKEAKNDLTLYIMNEEPDKRNYLYGNTWDNDILNDYNGMFTYSYVDNYNNTFDLIIGQSLLDVPCRQFNSDDTAKNIVKDLTDSRTELMNILQIQAELKQVENIYLFDDSASMGLLTEGQLIEPSFIKNHFSLDRVAEMTDDDLNLIENPVYIYQIYPALTHNASINHSNESGILFGFIGEQGTNQSTGSYIKIDIAANEEEAEWHAPAFYFLAETDDDTKFYHIDLFSEEEYNSFVTEGILYKEDNDGVKQLAEFDDYDESSNSYYTKGKQYMHVTYHKGELYYSDITFYRVIKGKNSTYYLDMTNPYYNFDIDNMNGYFLIYNNDEKKFKITKGYSSKIYINTGATDATLGVDGQLYANGKVLNPYLDLAITQEFKTELIPNITDIYVGNGVILNLSYHARQINYDVEGNNTALKIAKENWEKAAEEYTNYFYTKTDRDSYVFDEQLLYWNSLFNGSEEDWNKELYGYDEPGETEEDAIIHHEGLEDKRKKAQDAYNEYLEELQKALDAREAQRSWEKYQEVNGNE